MYTHSNTFPIAFFILPRRRLIVSPCKITSYVLQIIAPRRYLVKLILIYFEKWESLDFYTDYILTSISILFFHIPLNFYYF